MTKSVLKKTLLLLAFLSQFLLCTQSVKISNHFVLASNEKNKRNNIIIEAKGKAKSNDKEKTKKGILSSKHAVFRLPDGLKNGLASGLASVLVKSILQPFDTIKTVQQANTVKLSLLNALVTTIEKKGVLGLWSGIGVTVLGSAPSSAAYFGVYSSTKAHLSGVLKGQWGLATVAISAAIANTFASFIRAPFEVIKQRMQTGAHKTTLEAISYSFQKEGVFGLFGKGKLVSQIVRDVPYAIVCLLTYEILQTTVKQYLVAHATRSPTSSVGYTTTVNQNKNKKGTKISTTAVTAAPDVSVVALVKKIGVFVDTCVYSFLSNRQLRDALCGSVAGGLGSLFTTPMDVIKTRLMTDAKYGSLWVAVTTIAKQEGLGTFFRGASPRLMHKIPANALFFLFYEAFRSLLGVSMTSQVVSK